MAYAGRRSYDRSMTTFQGIPAAAFGFYAALDQNNNRQWWDANKDSYQEFVREPLELLLAELGPRFGPGKIFRPYRDMRFSSGASPYKTAQGAVASIQEGVGYYLHVGVDGLRVGGGCHSHSPAQLLRYRNSVDSPATGRALGQAVDGVVAAGFTLDGGKLKTVPRGFAPEHPRAGLLKHQWLSAHRSVGRPEWVSTPAAAENISALWDGLRPLVEWLGRHAAP